MQGLSKEKGQRRSRCKSDREIYSSDTHQEKLSANKKSQAGCVLQLQGSLINVSHIFGGFDDRQLCCAHFTLEAFYL